MFPQRLVYATNRLLPVISWRNCCSTRANWLREGSGDRKYAGWSQQSTWFPWIQIFKPWRCADHVGMVQIWNSFSVRVVQQWQRRNLSVVCTVLGCPSCDSGIPSGLVLLLLHWLWRQKSAVDWKLKLRTRSRLSASHAVDQSNWSACENLRNWLANGSKFPRHTGSFTRRRSSQPAQLCTAIVPPLENYFRYAKCGKFGCHSLRVFE